MARKRTRSGDEVKAKDIKASGQYFLALCLYPSPYFDHGEVVKEGCLRVTNGGRFKTPPVSSRDWLQVVGLVAMHAEREAALWRLHEPLSHSG